LSGHITGSSWIIDSLFSKTLLVHHAKLDKWLQPGGHADGEENVMRVAKKELKEETGIQTAKLFSKVIFDLDIHVIPEHKQTPMHHHYDIRYLFLADDKDYIKESKESKEVKWWPLDSISELVNNERSIIRMVEKSRKLSQIIRSEEK
jgi:ADP-ribose pyrophosphatase YjhB (NUDIX family)